MDITNEKFLTVRWVDIRAALDSGQQDQLQALLERVADHRRSQHKPGEAYFVLNPEDKFAARALEAYCDAVDEDENARENVAAQMARRAATKVLMKARVCSRSRMPMRP